METLQTPKSLQETYAAIEKVAPLAIGSFKPINAVEQKEAFLSGAVYVPDHVYDKVDAIDFASVNADIDQLGAELINHPDMNPKFKRLYTTFVEKAKSRTRLIELARLIKHTDDPEVLQDYEAEYMGINIEMYGKPDEATYRSILHSKLRAIDSKELRGRALELKHELFEMTGYDPSAEVTEIFRPSDETVDWMHDFVMGLCGGMLEHVPKDKEIFSAQEICDVFNDIIEKEFGEAAGIWKSVLGTSQNINVEPVTQQIIVPEDREPVNNRRMRELVVHELGVHFLRSIMGGETDLFLLARGVFGYLNADEGLGQVFQQAMNKEVEVAGLSHYITAGAAYYDKKDFRQLFEMKWRLEALESAGESGEVSEATIGKARNTSYDGVMRSLRGTDKLPWFKDLAYFYTQNMWQYLESIHGDDYRLQYLMVGRTDPENSQHERAVYETKTV